MASRLVGGAKRRATARAGQGAEFVAAKVGEELTPQFESIIRVLDDQSDAASEVAGAFGRVLARLSADVEALAGEVARLHARLDQLESPVHDG